MSCYDCTRLSKLAVYTLVLRRLEEKGYKIDEPVERMVEEVVSKRFRLEDNLKTIAEEVYQEVLDKLIKKNNFYANK